MNWTCACGATNITNTAQCEACNQPRIRAIASPPIPRRCKSDGATLAQDGYCTRGQGYPLDLACSFACPYCRQSLDWSGGCLHCHGSATPLDRDTWTFPGDRYERDDEHGVPLGDGHHWRKVLSGPRPVYRPTQEEIATLHRALAVLARSVEPENISHAH